MALAEEEHLSPEEKLLRVIQNDGEVQEDASPEEKLAAAVTEADGDVAQASSLVSGDGEDTGKMPMPREDGRREAEVAASSPERPKLKLAEKEEEGTHTGEATAASVAETEPSSPQVSDLSPQPSPAPSTLALHTRKTRAKTSGIAVANKVLAVAVLVVILLAAAEIFATLGVGTSGARRGGEVATPSGSDAPILASQGIETADPDSLQKILELYRKNPILNRASGGTVDPGKREPGIVAYLQKNMKFLGSSTTPEGETEAILADARKNKMSFMTAGQKMPVQISDKKDPEDVKLVTIHADHVLFEYRGQPVMVQ